MTEMVERAHFKQLYETFSSPITHLDCGQKCGPYNEHAVPICCDINLVIPAAYQKEWEYLQDESDLWKPWLSESEKVQDQIHENLQEGQVLIQCLGHKHCQRQFRSITCRAFPFYPYLTSSGEFLGLGYYWDFRNECWIISNLAFVSLKYKLEFKKAYQRLFDLFPDTLSAYLDFCSHMREVFTREDEDIVVMGFCGELFLVDPDTEGILKGDYDELKAYGPFQVTKEMKFPNEVDELYEVDELSNRQQNE
jgi:hypothetical protein